MNKVFICFLFLAYNQFANSQLPSKSDLELRNNVFYHNGEIYTGQYECYYSNGERKGRGQIYNGRLDGTAEFYNNKGDTTTLCWYSEGQLEKRRLFTYNPTGKIVTTLDDNDKLHGLSERYYPNGSIKERQFFNHGNSVGKWTTWDKKGRIIIETDFTDEVITTRKIHDYKWGRHKVLIQHFDKKTNKVVFKKVKKNLL